MADGVASVRGLAARLSLPLPARTRLLNELRHDLDGLTARLEERGLAPDEARRRARETLIPDDATLRELERMATPWYRRLTASVDPERLMQAERTAWVLGLGGLLTVEASTLLGAGLLRDPSPFLWPVLTLGALLLTSVLGKGFQLWIKGADHDPGRGLGVIAGLACCTLAVGAGGALVDLTLLATTLEASPGLAGQLISDWLVRDAAMLSAAIILSVAGGLGWLALRGWVARVQHEHELALRPDAASK